MVKVRSNFESGLTTVWQRKNWVSWALWDVSHIYKWLVQLRRWMYVRGFFKSYKLAVPVVVVGNVIAGGAGKTPTVIGIAQHLQAKGWRVGVVSRGYGRVQKSASGWGLFRKNLAKKVAQEVLPSSTPSEVGDEALLIARSLNAPVFVANNRHLAATSLLNTHKDVNIILCDDGLQHLALQRDVEVVVFDNCGVGNGWTLPAGPLREPWPRKDASKQIVLNTGSAPQIEGFHATRSLAAYALAQDGSQVPLAALTGKPIHAVAGIANPEAFFGMLRDVLQVHGLLLAGKEPLPDHYNFNSYKRPYDSDIWHICTEKDAAKLWAIYPDALAVPLVQTIEPAMLEALDAKLADLPIPP
jgi:tetraacyldisaccharide 4'-kinase